MPLPTFLTPHSCILIYPKNNEIFAKYRCSSLYIGWLYGSHLGVGTALWICSFSSCPICHDRFFLQSRSLQRIPRHDISHRLPNRLYPYNLLAKLYAEPEYYRPDKCCEMIDKVLHWNPKVPSEAIEEMKLEMDNLKKKL